MVVKTRSYYYSNEEQEQEQEQWARDSSSPCSADYINITTSVVAGGGRRVRITTPSFREASIRTYKVYTPTIKPSFGTNNKEREAAKKAAKKATKKAAKAAKAAKAVEDVEAEAIDALLALEQDDELECGSGSSSIGFESAVKHTCMNPMNPITTYMYRISVYNLDRTAHLKTAYILYDPKSRMYYVYTIISNQIDHHHHDPHAMVVEEGEPIVAAAAWALPEPKNTLQMKFTAFVGETISNYVMSLIIPSKEYDYYIQDDIIGLVSSNSDTHATANAIFGEDSSFYDIERLLYDQSSRLTTNGFKAFMLLPSRQFWYTSYYYSASGAISDNRYTYHTMDSVLLILGQSQ